MSLYSTKEGEIATCKVSAKLQCLARLEIATISTNSQRKGHGTQPLKGCLSNHSRQVHYARGELSTAAQLPPPTDLPAKEDPHLAFGAVGLVAELGEVQQRR